MDRETNLSEFSRLISPVAGKTDLVILPEMFNTGFTVEPRDAFEDPHGPTGEWMKLMAKSGGHAMCGSYIVRDKKNFFNRFLFVTPEGDAFSYDKRHLFSIGGENTNLGRGKDRVIIKYRGFSISVAICYDLRFPVWLRNRGDYDLLVVSANWPEARISVWDTLLRARAIENQCYVAGVNRTGTDGTGITYNGRSAVLDFRGEALCEAGEKTGSVLTAELNHDALENFRDKFPVWKDADDFSLKF